MMRLVSLAAALMLAVLPVAAEETTPPDYSKERLILMFREDPKARGGLEVTPYEIRYTRGDWMVRFVPIVAAILVNDGSTGPTPSPVVDPFFLTNMEFPYSRENVPVDELSAKWAREEKRYRHKMLAFVRAVNARENER